MNPNKKPGLFYISIEIFCKNSIFKKKIEILNIYFFIRINKFIVKFMLHRHCIFVHFNYPSLF